MPYKDLHNKPFDEGTLCKLEIFEAYMKAWLPTFIMQEGVTNICVFDLFAGPGYGQGKIEGSPVRLLKQISSQVGNIFRSKVRINVWLNEFVTSKYNNLVYVCEDYIRSDKELRRLQDCNLLNLKITNNGIDEIFEDIIKCINKYPSLVFLDQNGVKFTSDEYFIPLVNSKKTDFLFYVASSYIRRFAKQPEFRKALSFDLDDSKNGLPSDIHRWVVKKMQSRIPESSNVRLYPFSIKKASNTYGIIFGASHPRAVDKFLTIAWDKNNINGEANFDIDSDKEKLSPDLFGYKQLTKIEKFEEELKLAVLSGKLHNNKDVFDYTIEHGHIGRHANEVLKLLKDVRKISYEGRSPKCNYENVYKKKVFVEYHLL